LFLPSLRLRVATRSSYLLRVRAALEAEVGEEKGAEGLVGWRAS